MKILLLVTFLFVVNCKLSPIVDTHGSHFLEKKEKKLTLNKSNKNDIISLLGSPSTKSSFDSSLWIYIERKKTRSRSLVGKRKIYKNNVLLLEIDNKGLLVYKKLYNIDDMEDIEFVKGETEISYSNKSFVYDFLSSMRQKVNDPLGVRAKKRKKIKNQQ
tara:strand:+ start:63 stop:542 length:480 start_codon:yes stop_codon:yes gene_type:complete